MATLVILLAVGYVCAKLKIVGPEFNRGLSRLVIHVFLSALILSSVINKDLDITGSEAVTGFIMIIIETVICFALGMLTPTMLRIKDGDKGMYRLLAAFMNNGFMGFPLVAAIYGDTWVFFASLSNIPFNLLLYTLGVLQLQERDGTAKLKLRSILSTPLIATLIATVIFAFKIPIPAVIDDTLDSIAAATVPVSMMCIGLSLGDVPIKNAFIQPKLYGICFVRLLLAPLAVWFVLHFFPVDPVILGTIVVLSACPSAVICSILGMQYGRDGVEASEAIFLCTILSVITMPLLLSVLGLT